MTIAHAMCTLYSPKAVDQGCNPLQRHGFSPYCREDQPEGSCSVPAGVASTDRRAAPALARPREPPAPQAFVSGRPTTVKKRPKECEVRLAPCSGASTWGSARPASSHVGTGAQLEQATIM